MSAEILLQWLNPIIGLGASIVLLLVTNRINRRNKKEDDARAEAQEVHKKEMKEIMDLIKSLKDDVDAVRVETDGIKDELEAMRKFDLSVKSSLKHVSSKHETFGKYISQIGNVVMTLAEGMRDEHLDGNITAAIQSFRKFEREQLNDYIQQSPIDET